MKEEDKIKWTIQYLENSVKSLEEDLKKLKKLLRKKGIKVFNTK